MIYSAAGAKFYIGGTIALKNADYDVADFNGQTWVEIEQYVDLGAIGDEADEIGRRTGSGHRVQRLKGRRSGVTMDLICNLDGDDPGQTALIEAERDEYYNYAFRLVFPEPPQGGTPAERLFIAVVGRLTEQYDDGSDSMQLNASLWLNSNVVRIEETA